MSSSATMHVRPAAVAERCALLGRTSNGRLRGRPSVFSAVNSNNARYAARSRFRRVVQLGSSFKRLTRKSRNVRTFTERCRLAG